MRAEKGVLMAIGGTEDHLHMCLSWKPDGSLSELMRVVKSPSSNWMHEACPDLPAFGWREGYSAFSISKSQEAVARRYIARQVQHHAKQDFKEELLRLFRAHDVQFDEKYVFY